MPVGPLAVYGRCVPVSLTSSVWIEYTDGRLLQVARLRDTMTDLAEPTPAVSPRSETRLTTIRTLNRRFFSILISWQWNGFFSFSRTVGWGCAPGFSTPIPASCRCEPSPVLAEECRVR